MGDAGATARAAASITVAAIQAAVAYDVARKQNNVADRATKIAEKTHNTWLDNHLPCELKALAAACQAAVYSPQYSIATARAQTDVELAFSRQRQEMRRATSAYCVGSLLSFEREFAVAKALGRVDAVAEARRREEGRAITEDQRAQDNRFRLISLGRGLLSQSDSASRLAAQALNSSGVTIASAVNSGAQLLGDALYRDTGGSSTKALPGADGFIGGRGGFTPGADQYQSFVPESFANRYPTTGVVEMPQVNGGVDGGVGDPNPTGNGGGDNG